MLYQLSYKPKINLEIWVKGKASTCHGSLLPGVVLTRILELELLRPYFRSDVFANHHIRRKE
jgi:hypothetical protein